MATSFFSSSSRSIWAVSYTHLQIDDLIGEINQRTARKERVLVTTLTKKMAEDLTIYLQGAGIRVRYMHHDIDTIERMEIIRDQMCIRDRAWDGTSFIFSVTGYGHGVGMSQYGANTMAKEGSSFRDILTWYYTGAQVDDLWAES